MYKTFGCGVKVASLKYVSKLTTAKIVYTFRSGQF